MNSNTVQHKIKAFISSRCDSPDNFKYAPIRKNLQYLLGETGMIETYCFESEPATSVELPEDYISELQDTQVLILLVDNKDGISDATLKEYRYAIAHQIRIIALFCYEKEPKQTEIEKEILESNKCHVERVYNFSEMAFEAYKSVMQDLAKVYKQKPETINQEYNQKEIFLPGYSSYDYNISKELLNEFISTRKTLWALISNSKNDVDTATPIDNGFSLFLKTVLCLNKHNSNSFEQIETLIAEKHNDSIKDIIKERLNAVNEYYSGNVENALAILQDCLENKVKDCVLPEWLKNDIAIDIRNIEMKTNRFLNGTGQVILDNSKEYAYFPIIDRLSNNIQTNIINFYTEIFQESPYTSTTRSLEYIFNDLASYYCTALFYGSITHLNLVKKLLQKLLFVLSLKQEDAHIFNKLIYFTLLLADEKQIDKILRIKNPFLLNFLDTKSLIIAIDNLPIEQERIQSKLILLKDFGYVLLDDEFKSISEWFIEFAKKYFSESFNYSEYHKIIIDTLKGVCNRIPNESIFGLIKEVSIFGDKGRNFICQSIVCLLIKKLTEEQQEFLKNYFIDIVNDGEAYKRILDFQSAVLFYCKNSTINIENLIELIKEKSSEIYRLLRLEMFDNDKKSSIKNINYYILNIKTRTETQKKGAYIGFSDNPFVTIKNIVDYNNVSLNQAEIKAIVDPTTNFLLSNTQSYGDKCSALELLIFLASKFRNEFPWKKIKIYLKNHTDKLLECANFVFFDKTSLDSLKFYYQVFTLSISSVQDIDTISACANLYAMSSYDKIICLKLLSVFLENIDVNKDINKNSLNSIIQLSVAMLKDEECDVRIYATKCLVAMLDSVYIPIILHEMSHIMNVGDVYSKRIVVLALKQKDIHSDEVDFILQKAKTDRNYYIREVL